MMPIRSSSALLIGAILAACDSTPEVRFVCRPNIVIDGSACPVADQPCPKLPLDSGGCDEVTGWITHPPLVVDAGSPVGCEVTLPYRNPNFGNEPVRCYCVEPPRWGCPS